MKKSLRIAMVASYPPEAVLREGQFKERYRGRIHPATPVRSLSGPLHRHVDMEVRVFVHSRAVTRVREGEEDGVPFTFVPKYEPGNLDPFHAHVPAVLQMTPVIQRFKPDIVQGFGTEGVNAHIAAAQHGRPSVVFLQGIIEKLAPFSMQSGSRLRAGAYFERRAVRRAQGVIAETRFAADWARSLGTRAQVEVIPHPVDQAWFACRPDFAARNLLAIGTLNRIKGMDTVLHAFAACPAREGVVLHIVGAGPCEAALRTLAVELGVNEGVKFHGQLDRDQVMDLMAEASAVVLGSRMDTAPNVVTEAHAAGLPVVATRAGGIPDMIEDGQDGYVVDVDQPDQMAERLGALLDDPAACRSMGDAGRKKVAELNDADRIVDAFLAYYRSLLAG